MAYELRSNAYCNTVDWKCEECTAAFSGKTEEMPEGHMWQWFLKVQHTTCRTDAL